MKLTIYCCGCTPHVACETIELSSDTVAGVIGMFFANDVSSNNMVYHLHHNCDTAYDRGWFMNVIDILGTTKRVLYHPATDLGYLSHTTLIGISNLNIVELLKFLMLYQHFNSPHLALLHFSYTAVNYEHRDIKCIS